MPIYKDKVKLEKLLPEYAIDIKGNKIAEYLSEDAIALNEERKFAEAAGLLDFANTLVYMVNDSAGKAAYHLNHAQVYQDNEKYEAAIAECDLSIKFAQLSGRKELELSSMMKKAYCMYKISRFAEAKKTLALVEQKSALYRSSISDIDYQNTMKKRFEYEGRIYAEEGNFDQALKYYQSAIEANSLVNSYESKLKNAEFYSYIGSVYNDQGKQDSALKAYIKAFDYYTAVRDDFNFARTLNKIGYTRYLSSQYRNSIEILEQSYVMLSSLQDYNEAGYAKTVIGSAYWQLGKFDSAVISHKEAIALREKGNNKRGQAFSWKQIGELYLLSGLKTEALQAFDASAALYIAGKDLNGVAETYIKAGTVHQNDENYYKAAQYYEKARGVTPKTNVEALYNLGNVWSRIDKVKSAQYFTECKLKSDSTGNTSYQFYATKAMASLAYEASDIAKGDQLYGECLSIAQELNTPEVFGYCNSLRGDRFIRLSEMDSALFYLNKAYTIFDTVSKESAIWQMISIATSVYVSTGEFDKAEKMLLDAAGIAKDINQNIAQGSALQNLSFVYSLTGEVEKGLTANDSALAIFKRSGNVLRLADAYGSRGSVYKVVGEYKKSIKAFKYADSIYLEEKVDGYRKNILNNIAVTYFNQGDYNKTYEYLEMSGDLLSKNLMNEDFILYKANVAECFYYLKRTAEAKKMFLEFYPEASKRNLNRMSSSMALSLGMIYFDENNLEKAADYFEQSRKYAEASKERSKLIDALLYLGKIDVKQSQFEKAEPKFQQAIAITKSYNIASGWEAYYEMGLLFYNQSNFDSCITYFRTAVNLLNRYTENVYGDDKAKKLFNNDPKKSDLYFKLAFAYSKTGKPEEAFAFANLSSLAGLKDLGGGGLVPGFEKEAEELEKKKQKANALRASASKQTGQAKVEILKQLQVAEKDYSNFLMGLVKKDEKFNSYYPQEANPSSFYKYKGELPDDVAVVLFMLNNNNLMTFTLTNEALSINVDSLNREISGIVNAFALLSSKPGKGTGTEAIQLRAEARDEEDVPVNISFVDASDMLYQVLIGSVYDKIKTKKRICIIPNGKLSNLPFQCLGQKTAGGKFKFFIEDHGLFYTNDIGIFAKSRTSVPEKTDMKSFAAFGVLDDKLKHNITEVKEIGRIIGSEKTVFADARATERQAKSSLVEKKYLHFATHGVLNYSEDYTLSYLKFLPDQDTSEGNNGKLTILEIQEMPLKGVNLVTLSACETGVSQQLAQSWNLSPANAFILRGAQSAVASLWKVDDEATSILMNEFYANLNKKMDKVDALRLAQVKLSNNPKYTHPFYWGAFVLYGEWR
jgi:CHAT domain-containing protein/tetratricopeptide (TPR) repeat protein